jgi:hypothetical protein
MTIRGMDAASFQRLGNELGHLLSEDKDPRRANRILEWARRFPLPRP